MKRILFVPLFFIFIAGFQGAYCQDNLLAVDTIADQPHPQAEADKPSLNNEDISSTQQSVQEPESADDSEEDFKKIKAYRQLLENKQKELEIIRLDLEKSGLLLKKRQAEKEIFEIDKVLPEGKNGLSESGLLGQGAKELPLDPAEVKIQLLLISDNLKEAMIILKGTPYVFKEGDCIASKLTAERIEPSGINFRQPDGSTLKLNFIN